MQKVKEFLDANFKHKNTTETLKEDGHNDVRGVWLYTIKQGKGLDYKNTTTMFDNCISCHCKDESLFINIVVNGEKAGYYDSVTTSLDIPVGEPDEKGFYDRWSDEEVIHYIKSYMDIINQYK